MTRFLLYTVVLLIILIGFGCSTSTEKDSLDEEKTATFSTSLHTVDFKDIDKENLKGKDGFYLTFTITALDETRTLDSSQIRLVFPQEIEDRQGKTYHRFGDAVLQQRGDKQHIIQVRQFFSGTLSENSSHLIVPTRLVIANLDKMVRFNNITEQMIPVTRQELTINRLESNGNEIKLEAEDIFPMVNPEWRLIINDEKIYPVFSNTETNEEGEFQGTFEFAFQPEETFTLVAERKRTTKKEWDLPFVVPVSD